MPEVGTGNLPNLAPSGAGSKDGVGVHHPPSAKEISFTDAQVDEFREQDRWLPVRGGCPPFDSYLCSTMEVHS